MVKYRPKSEKTPENTKNHTFLDLWVIVTPEIVLKLFIKFKPGLMKIAQPYFITNLDIGVQKCSKILKNSPKSEKTPENTKNQTVSNRNSAGRLAGVNLGTWPYTKNIRRN